MRRKNRNKMKLNSIIPALLFLIIIGGFFILSFVVKDKSFSENENRTLKLFPEISLQRIEDGDFTKNFEMYIQDQFPLRDAFMSGKTKADILIGKTDNGSVYFGKKGYLFSIEKLDIIQLKKNIGYIEKFSESVDNDLNISLMVIPTASYVLKEYLPKNAEVQNEAEAIGIIKDSIDDNYINLYDIRIPFINITDEYLYYRTDHHWTTLGAFYAYRYWVENYEECSGKTYSRKKIPEVKDYNIERIASDFYGTNYSKALLDSIKPDWIDKFSLKKGTSDYIMRIYESSGKLKKEIKGLYDNSYLLKKDKYSYFISGNNPLTVIEKKDCKKIGKSLLMVKDSFSHCFVPFIAEDYDKAVVVDLRYYRKELKDLIKEYNINDVLFLYNVINLSNDKNLVFLKY